MKKNQNSHLMTMLNPPKLTDDSANSTKTGKRDRAGRPDFWGFQREGRRKFKKSAERVWRIEGV